VSGDRASRGGYRLAAACALALTCSDPPKPAVQVADLEGTLIARVGPEEIAVETVASIAAAQGVDARRALELATFDALAALEGRARGFDTAHRRELNAALARVMMSELANEARSEAPTPAEIEELHRDYEYWLEVARPAVVVTVHALVHVAKDADAAAVAAALAFAKRLAVAVAPSAETARTEPGPDHAGRLAMTAPKDPVADAFISLAQGVDKGGFTVTTELLPPVGDDNLTIEVNKRQPFDPDFVSGAFKLAQRGDVSEPVRSSFGYHVIMLLARIPAIQLSPEEEQRRLELRIVERRTHQRLGEMLKGLRARTTVVEERSIDGMLEQVRVTP